MFCVSISFCKNAMSELMLTTSAVLFWMFEVTVSSLWPHHLFAPVTCFASYGCGALSIFALFTSSLSYCSVSLDCEVHVLHDHHLLSLAFRRCADDGKFVLQFGLQHTSVLPSLLVSTGSSLFVKGRGLLGLILVTLFVVVIAFTFTRALHDALQHVRFHVLDDSSSSAVFCDFSSVDFSNCSIGLLIRLDSVPSLPLRTPAV